MKLPDEFIIKRCIEGDNDAFSLLVDRYQSHVYGLCYRMVGNFADAQDLAQEAFVKAYLELTQIRDHSKFDRWIYSITVNICRMWLRAKRKLHNLSLDAIQLVGEDFHTDAYLPHEYVEAEELHLSVKKAINSLPQRNRVVANMYYIDGLTYREIGDLLRLSESIVKSRLHRARVYLRKELGTVEKPYDPEWAKIWRLGVDEEDAEKRLGYFKEALEMAKKEDSIEGESSSEASIRMMDEIDKAKSNVVFWGAGTFRTLIAPSSIEFYTNMVFCTSMRDFRERVGHPDWRCAWQPLSSHAFWGPKFQIPLPIELNKSIKDEFEYEKISLVSTITALSKSIKVGSTIFEDCLELQTSVKMEGEEKYVPHVCGNVTSWFAPKVGLVKEQYLHSDGDETLTELVDYSVTENPESELPLNVGNRWEYRGTKKSNPVVAKHVFWVKGVMEYIESGVYVWYIPFYSISTL